jgi:hypothetical protein
MGVKVLKVALEGGWKLCGRLRRKPFLEVRRLNFPNGIQKRGGKSSL